MGVKSRCIDRMIVGKAMEGRSLTFSALVGSEGCVGKGKARVLIEGCLERSGFKIERFLGVTSIVMLPVDGNDVELKESIIQYLVAGAAMGRAHYHIARRNGQRRSSIHVHPQNQLRQHGDVQIVRRLEEQLWTDVHKIMSASS
ncbi:hypothetical protein LOK49_LG14G00411 [Camellia lanceoleosa]|uniref:Uncharacterized protein n=1 Tax=Camellia lanceoleosa TaxID=1840588 RepID=A0ACC0F8D2_9ERIC|nr:hypothetical protein LOK49_LG14G00411 [Camellia lanceoleosa]